jgi:photosystem II stability/assembly factor-like uncharacterized protein
LNTTYWMEFDPAVKGKAWAVMSATHDLPRWRMFRKPGAIDTFRGGVVVTTDGGRTWSNSSEGLPDIAPSHILLDPSSPPDARVLYITGFGRGVFRSTDGGRHWTMKSHGLPTEEPLAWRMAMDRNRTLYLVTVGRPAENNTGAVHPGWLFRSPDAAENWDKVPLPEGLETPHSLTPDPDDPARLYLATWGSGVFLSTDAGGHWANVLSVSGRIYDITVDPQVHHILYAATYEHAVWRSADRGLTWMRIPGFNFKLAQRVIPDPADRTKIYITTFGSSVWHGPAEGDPNAVEDIVAPPALTFRAIIGNSR